MVDILFGENDVVEIEMQDDLRPGRLKLYVHVNGRTVLRVGNLPIEHRRVSVRSMVFEGEGIKRLRHIDDGEEVVAHV